MRLGLAMLTAVTVSNSVFAAPPSESKRLGNVAARAFAAGRYDEALRSLESALRLEDAAAAHFNAAICLDKLGRLAEALAHLARAESLETRATGRRAIATFSRDIERRLSRDSSRVTPRPTPATARVVLNGAAVVTGWPVWLRAGVHGLTVEAAGYRKKTLQFKVVAGVDAFVDVELGALPRPEDGAPAARRALEPTPAPPTVAVRPWLWTGLGTGIAVAGAGIALVVLGQRALDDAEARDRPSWSRSAFADSLQASATKRGVGIALAASGAVVAAVAIALLSRDGAGSVAVTPGAAWLAVSF